MVVIQPVVGKAKRKRGSGDERTEDGKTKCNMGAKHQQPENLCLTGENGREMGSYFTLYYSYTSCTAILPARMPGKKATLLLRIFILILL